ncbi:uncharacterized protein [Palaemon carinicauda]|uniref:uncharacterized protein n=1 Tax=Palaemon carinicauda TaxID=392227 RepID=UPI0035B58846
MEVQSGENFNLQNVDWDSEAFRQAQNLEFHTDNDEAAFQDITKPFFFRINDLLYRVSRAREVPADKVEVKRQLLVLKRYREKLLSLAHESSLSGHFGVRKCFQKLAELYFWPRMRRDVKRFVSSCQVCQLVGKPNQKIPKAPLIPISAVGEPFREVIIDVVGPLPLTRGGCEYLLTLVDRMSRYPEAIPLRSVKAEKVVEALINFFTKFGIPKVLQSDCGTNFTSRTFRRKMLELRVKHITSSPYHPESQGQVERLHQTLKSVLNFFCYEHDTEWDKDVPYALFAIRAMPNESLGFSPFQLVFGHNVRGPLDVVREHLESNGINEINVIDYFSNLQEKLRSAWEFARNNLATSQSRMKFQYDLGTMSRSFEVGDEVLVLLPLPGNMLKAQFSGPWKILKKLNEVNYVIETPQRRRKTQICHINMLKPLVKRKGTVDPVAVVNVYEDLEVEVDNTSPIKQCPYRLNPFKRNIVQAEVNYMLDHDLIKPNSSPWSSPVVLVKKESDQHRLCFDYRRLNEVTKTDSHPLPRVEDCIDRIGSVKYLSKFDLLKGYWQVGLTPRAQEVSAFVTGDGLYECKVMPFVMKNAAATFQRLMNLVTSKVKGCVVHIDDVVIYSDDWESHIKRIRALFEELKKTGLVIKLKKSEFARAKIVYLGHEVGLGKISVKQANVEAITEFPIPKNKRDVWLSQQSLIGLSRGVRTMKVY